MKSDLLASVLIFPDRNFNYRRLACEQNYSAGCKNVAIPTPVRVPGLSLEAVAGVMTGPDQDKVSRVPVQRRQTRLAP